MLLYHTHRWVKQQKIAAGSIYGLVVIYLIDRMKTSWNFYSIVKSLYTHQQYVRMYTSYIRNSKYNSSSVVLVGPMRLLLLAFACCVPWFRVDSVVVVVVVVVLSIMPFHRYCFLVDSSLRVAYFNCDLCEQGGGGVPCWMNVNATSYCCCRLHDVHY